MYLQNPRGKSNNFILKSVSKVLSPRLKQFITSRIFEVEAQFKLSWKVYEKGNIDITRKSETPGNFGCPKGVEKSELFSQETYHSQNFRHETLKSPLSKKLSVSLLPHFV